MDTKLVQLCRDWLLALPGWGAVATNASGLDEDLVATHLLLPQAKERLLLGDQPGPAASQRVRGWLIEYEPQIVEDLARVGQILNRPGRVVDSRVAGELLSILAQHRIQCDQVDVWPRVVRVFMVRRDDLAPRSRG